MKQLNVVVCIKQVPASSDVSVDPVTGVLIRDGNNTKMNPYDLYGIETALRIKEQSNAYVKTITMGPPPAKAVLEESLWMGCDDALLMSDRKFGGADVVATSYTLSQGIKHFGNFDIIICGKQTTDGDTAQVGAEMAEFLGIPHVAYVDYITNIYEDSIDVVTVLDKTIETINIKFPCLITVDKTGVVPRLPSYKRGRELKNYEIKTISLADLDDQNENKYGLKGSPTQVERIFPPIRNKKNEIIKGTDESLANTMFNILKDSKFI